jgi:starch-binding outer membrane protein, SusD/RagB family
MQQFNNSTMYLMKPRITLILVFSLLASACQDDFLDLAPVTERNVQDFYNTAADFNNAVIGTYNNLKAGGVYNNSLIWMGEVASDNTEYGVTRSPVNVYNFEFIDHNFTGLNTVIFDAWRDHYQGIARTNAILGRIEAAQIPETPRRQYTGEAQFMRALFYFNLVRLFGDVPLVTREITSPDEGRTFRRNPAEEVYQLIISDLIAAEQNLPETYPANQAGRVNRWGAKALLGKVYLTRGEYANAAAKLKEVMDSQQYELLSSYEAVFSPGNPNNREILFAVQYKGGQIGQGSNFWERFAPWQSGAAVLGPNGGGGGGINRPTADLENAYEAGDLRKDFSIQNQYTNAQGAVVFERYVTKYKQFGVLANESDVDFPVLRYADVLLMYAEALNEQGSGNPEAGNALNAVRLRAGLEAISPADQAAFRLAVEQERRVELAFENQRWFDLVRTGRFVEVMQSKGYEVQPHNVVYVIPQREIDLNANLTQNQGY